MAFWRLIAVASVRLSAALIFMDTAKPPASSLELTIRDPLESLCRLFWRASLVFPRLRPEALAAELTLIDIIMIYLGCDPIHGSFHCNLE